MTPTRLPALAVAAALVAALPGLSPRAQAQAPAETVYRYLGVKWCKGCHSRQSNIPALGLFHTWEDSAHARAWETLPPEHRANPECLRCHTTGYGLPRRPDVPDEELRGVQCEACHGPGSHYFTWSVMKDPERARRLGLVTPTREVCARCHW